jgi:hypothetical protein
MTFEETGCDRTQVPMSLGLLSMILSSGLNKVSLSLATIQSLRGEITCVSAEDLQQCTRTQV